MDRRRLKKDVRLAQLAGIAILAWKLGKKHGIREENFTRKHLVHHNHD